jgi:hypothetical protein
LASPELTAREVDPWIEGGERYRRLRVTFPEAYPTHSSEQTFYFDEHLLLRRLDYEPTVFASWARAAQYCTAYRSFGGFEVPTRRRVYPRGHDGRASSAPLLVWLEVDDVRFE